MGTVPAPAPEGKGCCASCGDQGYCSPRSGGCYDSKKKDYYETCGNASVTEPVPATPATPEGVPACCASCGGKAYCSPLSGSCHDWKKKDYYEACFTGPAPCCSSCGGTGFCSPQSGKCYGEKRKGYYETCDTITAPEPTAPTAPAPSEGVPACCASCGDKGYCSPISGGCYDWKKKDYYETCFTGLAACCGSCEGVGFCSPQSGKCYSEKKKTYYESCSA